jgi:hypothetical protein
MRKYRIIVQGQPDVYIDAPMNKNVTHTECTIVIGDIASNDFVSVNFWGKIVSVEQM